MNSNLIIEINCVACDSQVNCNKQKEANEIRKLMKDEFKYDEDTEICFKCVKRHQQKQDDYFYSPEECEELHQIMKKRGYKLNILTGYYISPNGSMLLTRERINDIKRSLSLKLG